MPLSLSFTGLSTSGLRNGGWMWIAAFLRGLAVYLVSEHRQPLSWRRSSKDRPEEGLLLWRDGTAHQILQVVPAASCERIYSPLELASHLREPRRQQTGLNLHIFCSCPSLSLIDVLTEATCSLVVRPLDTK